MFYSLGIYKVTRDYGRAMKFADMLATALKGFPGFGGQLRGELLYLSGREAEAMEVFLENIELVESTTEEHNEFTVGFLVSANGYLGNRDEVRRLTNMLFSGFPIEDNTFDRPGIYVEAAKGLALVGDHGAALELLETLVDQPGAPSKWALHLDPSWDFMRDNERFAALTTPDGIVRE